MNNAKDVATPRPRPRPLQRSPIANNNESDLKPAAKKARVLFKKSDKTTVPPPQPLPVRESTVKLNTAPFKNAGTIAATKLSTAAMKDAMKELEDEYEPKMKKAKKDSNEVDSKTEEVRQKLLYAEAKLYPKQAQDLLDAIQQKGGNNAKIGPNELGSSDMQNLTNTTLSKEDIVRAGRNLRDRPSGTGGKFGLYKVGTETRPNKRGDKVNLNRSKVQTEQYEWMKEKNIGIPKRINELSHNLLTELPKNAAQLPHLMTVGKDFLRISEQPTNWDSEFDEPLTELIAQLHGFPNWRAMQSHLLHANGELGGMTTKRFIGNHIALRGQSMPAEYKIAGYLFTFDDGNDTRFDVSNQLSDEPAKIELTKAEYQKNPNNIDSFSFRVRKIGDEAFGTKAIRSLSALKNEVTGFNFLKKDKKGKREQIKLAHMPKVGEEKEIETKKGKFIVERVRE